jgi:hypothetical protein
MVRSSRTSANVITFPLHGKHQKLAANNWIFRIVESNEDLVAATHRSWSQDSGVYSIFYRSR